LRFRGSIHAEMADAENIPVEFYVPLQTDGLVFVADDAGELIGFAANQACEDALHLWELDVRQDRQSQGVGRALMQATIALARRRGLAAVTLTTFSDVTWNAPFYARLGFETLDLAGLNPRLLTIREREAQLGFDMSKRCAMRLPV
jgi:GNAT superfamily N-acetyltransferase